MPFDIILTWQLIQTEVNTRRGIPESFGTVHDGAFACTGSAPGVGLARSCLGTEHGSKHKHGGRDWELRLAVGSNEALARYETDISLENRCTRMGRWDRPGVSAGGGGRVAATRGRLRAQMKIERKRARLFESLQNLPCDM